MSKRKYIDYVLWLKENLTTLNITILHLTHETVTFQCNVCNVVRTVQIKSLYKRNGEVHSEACSKVINEEIKRNLGKDKLQMYRSMYRRSKERCSNPNNKDYKHYKGKFKFKDFSHFYLETYQHFLHSLQIYPNEILSIDRIDGNLGYEPNNIRFVPMSVNLQNKNCVKSIMCVNINTKETYVFPSANKVAIELLNNVNCTSSVIKNIHNNSIYKKTWKFFYIE